MQGTGKYEQFNDMGNGDVLAQTPPHGKPSLSSVFKEPHRAEVFAATTACLCTMSYGYSAGITSPSMAALTSEGRLPPPLVSWYSALLPLGTVIGSIMCGYSVERFGRKTTLVLSSSFTTIGCLFIIIDASTAMLLAGRFLSGVGSGLVLFPTPLYIAETASAEVRGTLISLINVTINTGLLLAFVISYYIPWRWNTVLASGVATLSILGMVLLPETPSWYLNKDREAEALESLLWLRRGDRQLAESQLKAMKKDVTLQTHRNASLLDLFRERRLRMPLIPTLILMTFQQFVGINAINFNLIQIFQLANFENQLVATTLVSLIEIVMSAVGAILMDVAGRRLLLVISGAVSTASLLAIGVAFYLLETSSTSSSSVSDGRTGGLALAGLLAFCVGYSVGWGPVPFVVLGEIYPPSARFIAGSLSITSDCFFSFVVTLTFAPMQAALHAYGSFWFYGGMSVLGTTLALIFLPETKGRSLEEIELYFQ